MLDVIQQHLMWLTQFDFFASIATAPQLPGALSRFGNFLTKAEDWLKLISGALVILVVMVGGFLWMTSGGDSSQKRAAKEWIVNAFIGLIIVFIATALVTTAVSVLGGK